MHRSARVIPTRSTVLVGGGTSRREGDWDGERHALGKIRATF